YLHACRMCQPEALTEPAADGSGLDKMIRVEPDGLALRHRVLVGIRIRNEVDAALGHERRGRVVEKATVLDGMHAGKHGVANALEPMGVCRDPLAPLARLVHGGLDLFACVRSGSRIGTIGEDATGCDDLDEIHSV